ncbi:MAG: N-acetyltransferase [Dehalococcoidia bacterium]|nr:N-acetyltransferase [Dehalococcoidia bacterium]
MTSTKPTVFATGQLVTLREKQPDDARRDYEWRRDPELAAYDAARPISISFRAFAATLSDELQSPSTYRRSFAIEDSESGRHIGNVMYYGYDAVRQEAELGITIGDRDYWSRGFGTDAVATMLLYLFRERGLQRVYLHTLSWNHRAQAAFTRAGFRFVRAVHRDGHDFQLMEVHRAEVLGAED